MLEVLKQFRVLLRTIDNHYRRVERRSGLGGAQVWALSEVAQAGGISVSELSQRLAIQVSTASNLVRKLEAMGLVTRARERSDQRIVRITATAKGRRKLGQAPKPRAGLLQEALLATRDADLAVLHKQLDRLMRRVDGAGSGENARLLSEMLGRPARR